MGKKGRSVESTGARSAGADASEMKASPTTANASGQAAHEFLRRQDESVQQRLADLSHLIRTWDWRARSDSPSRAPKATGGGAVGAPTIQPPAVAAPTIQPPAVAAPTIQPTAVAPITTLGPGSPNAPLLAGSQPNAPPQAGSKPKDRHDLIWPVVSLFLVLVITGGGAALYWIHNNTNQKPHHATSQHHATTRTRATTTLATRYLADEKPAHAAGVLAGQRLHQITGLPAAAVVSAAVTPYATALSQFNQDLARLRWPADLRKSSRALMVKVHAVVTQIETVNSVTQATYGSWLSAYELDTTSLQAAVNHLRGELGLSIEPVTPAR